MISNSKYKDQFQKSCGSLTSGGKNVKLDKSDAAQLEREMIELYPKAAEMEQLCLLMDRDYIDCAVAGGGGPSCTPCCTPSCTPHCISPPLFCSFT